MIAMYMALAFVQPQGMTGPCGTPYLVTHATRLPRPTNQTTFDTTHFRIHYDTTGAYAVDTSYARKIAECAEHSWEIEVDSLGLDAPPPDGSAGGDDRYDIHIIDLTGGVLGFTAPEGAGPDPNQEDYISYIAVDKDLNDWYKESTVSHEFMHACEFSYTGRDGAWFMENCAVWAEEMVYPDNNQYIGYVNGMSPIKRPNYPINHMNTQQTDLYEYGGVVWPMFLMHWTGDTDVIRTIWDTLGLHLGNHILEDIDGVLRRDYGDSLEHALGEYAIWRWFTGPHYDDFHWWPEVSVWSGATVVRSHGTYPASGDEGIFPPQGPGGCDFVVFRSFSNASDSGLVITFDGEDNWTWGAWVIGYRSGTSNPSDVYRIPLESGTNYGIDTIYTSEYDSLILVPFCVNWYSTTPELTFSYSADVVGLDEQGSQQAGFTGSFDGKSFSFNLPRDGEVRVALYDATGRRVFAQRERFSKGSGALTPGLRLEKGVYFWQMGFGDELVKGKALVF